MAAANVRHMNKLAIPVVVGIAAIASGVIGLASASAHPSLASGSCGPAHRYIDVSYASFEQANIVYVYGRAATLKCGGDDDSSYVSGKKISLMMVGGATVTFWKTPNDPSKGTRTFAATSAIRWFHRNRSEPIYKITGPPTAVTKLVEEWHP